jgi:hypothetical protein
MLQLLLLVLRLIQHKYCKHNFQGQLLEWRDIKDHYNDYLNTVGADEKWQYFWDDIEVLLKAKNDFIYEKKRNGITLKKSKPTFAFILKEKKDGDEVAFKQKLIDNDLSFVPTIYLPKESDYNNPSVMGHKLSKRYIR